MIATLRSATLTGLLAVVLGGTATAQASNTAYGRGCPDTTTWYQLFTSGFDLANRSIQLQLNAAGGWTVLPGSGTIDQNFAGNLALGDDQVSLGQPLGFPIAIPGAGTVTSVDIDSNGRCGWGFTASDYTETVTEFIATPMLCPFWDDLNPSTGGGVYFDALANYTMITWDGVPEYSASGSNTAQVKFFPSGQIEITWGSCTLGDCLVGFSDGSNRDPGGRDISTSLPFTTAGGGQPVQLAASGRPIINTTISMNVTGLPPSAVAGTLITGFSRASVSLDPLGMPACSLYTSAETPFGGFNPANAQVSVNVLNDPALNGRSMYWQAVVFAPGANGLGVLTSNGLETRFGLN